MVTPFALEGLELDRGGDKTYNEMYKDYEFRKVILGISQGLEDVDAQLLTCDYRGKRSYHNSTSSTS
jgi:hypothetical protein